jgi:hypothetical protein
MYVEDEISNRKSCDIAEDAKRPVALRKRESHITSIAALTTSPPAREASILGYVEPLYRYSSYARNKIDSIEPPNYAIRCGDGYWQ